MKKDFDKWGYVQGKVMKWAWSYYKAHQDTLPPQLVPRYRFAKSAFEDEDGEPIKGRSPRSVVDELVEEAMFEIYNTPSGRGYLKEEFWQERAKRTFRKVIQRYRKEWKESESGEAQYNYSLYLHNVWSGNRTREAQKKVDIMTNAGEYLTDLEDRVLRLRYTTPGASAKEMPYTQISRQLGPVKIDGKKTTLTAKQIKKMLEDIDKKIELWKKAFPPLKDHPDLDEDEE